MAQKKSSDETRSKSYRRKKTVSLQSSDIIGSSRHRHAKRKEVQVV